jgi:hypothetical protein
MTKLMGKGFIKEERSCGGRRRCIPKLTGAHRLGASSARQEVSDGTELLWIVCEVRG